MRRSVLMLASLMGLGSAALAQDVLITPIQAIEKAAAAAPSAVPGVFDMQVHATGARNGYVYLNSEDNYRDQRNLTVYIPPVLVAAVQAKFGAPPEVFFKGKHIHVRGEAARVAIRFAHNGELTQQYYYQTHVALRDPSMIEIVP